MILGGEDVLYDVNFRLNAVMKMRRRTQDDQVTSAPSAVSVSMRTAVWMVLERTI